MKKLLTLPVMLFFLYGCESLGRKVDSTTQQEEEKLSKFLQKTESELKIEFGIPDKIELKENRNKILIYYDSKFKIKCERKFEINPKNIVIGFSSKNCF